MSWTDPEADDGRPGLRQRRPRPMTVVRGVFVVLAVGLGVYAVTRDLDGFLAAVGRVGAARTAVACVIVLVGLWASAEVWRQAVVAVAGPLRPRAARSVFFVSQLGKYVPGGVWTIAAQVDLARRHGLRRSSMGAGALLFLALHLATGLLLAGVTVPFGAPELTSERPWIVVIAVVVGALGLVPAVLGWSLDRGLWLLRRRHEVVRVSGRRVLLASCWMVVVWVCFGLATATVAAPLVDDDVIWQLAAAATGGFAAAWVAGVLVIPAPAGVGAREVVLVLSLAPLTGVTAATSVAILLRVVHTAADLGLAALTSRLGPGPSLSGVASPGG